MAPGGAVSSFEHERGIWLSRYRMCVAVDSMNTDPTRGGFAEFALERSARRWRAVAGLVAAYIDHGHAGTLTPEDEDEIARGYGLSDDARAWLEELDYAKMFSPKVKR